MSRKRRGSRRGTGFYPSLSPGLVRALPVHVVGFGIVPGRRDVDVVLLRPPKTVFDRGFESKIARIQRFREKLLREGVGFGKGFRLIHRYTRKIVGGRLKSDGISLVIRNKDVFGRTIFVVHQIIGKELRHMDIKKVYDVVADIPLIEHGRELNPSEIIEKSGRGRTSEPRSRPHGAGRRKSADRRGP